MYNHASREHTGLAGFLATGGLLGALVVSGVTYVSPTSSAQEPEKEGMGLMISRQAAAEDVGLPIYAGSKPHKDDSHDSPSARLGLWGGGAGFKLAVVKMDSSDSPEKVAAFYRKALAKYGPVLDCSSPSSAPSPAGDEDSSKVLTCGDDKPEAGGILLKAGTKQRQHLVSVQPAGPGSFYQLVAVTSWKPSGSN